MTEQQYKELLKTLGIGTGKANADTMELLSAKLNEYLDRTDADAEQMVSDIQDAMDYVEGLIEETGGGIALYVEESDNAEDIDQDSLIGKVAGRKGPITYTASSASGGAPTTTSSGAQGGTNSAGAANAPSHPWFYSTTGDKNIEDLFRLAEGDLAQGDFRHAESVYDTILRTEMTNAGAYMGKVLARYNLQEPKDIATCFTQGLETDSDLKRVENCGNDKQKKFIQDALEERRQAKIYKDAERVLQDRNDVVALLNAATEFESLGAYRDAKEKAKKCREESEKVKEEQENQRKEDIYNKADGVLQNSGDITKLLNAATEFESLGEYRDAPQKADGCREKAKVQEREYWTQELAKYSLIRLMDKCKKERETIIEEVDYRLQKTRAESKKDKEVVNGNREKRKEYFAQKYISEEKMQRIGEIETNIVYGNVTGKERIEYLSILSDIRDRVELFLGDYEKLAYEMERSGFSEYYTAMFKKADRNYGRVVVPSKIQGTLREYIEECKENLFKECEKIKKFLTTVPTVNVKEDIEEPQEDSKDGAELVRIGVSYLYGYDERKKDINKAKEYFEKAANLGYAEGYTYLGRYYTVWNKNYGRAVKYYEEAIKRGSTKALLYLGDAYWFGNGVVSDNAMAESYYKRAGAEGEGLAFVRMGKLRQIYPNYNAGKEYYETCLEYYKKAAEMGEIEGLHEIVTVKFGDFKYDAWEQYEGIDVNIEEVIENYEKILEEISKQEMDSEVDKWKGYYNLGMLYKMKNNNERAWQIFHELINADSYYAKDESILEFFGDMYRTGIVVGKDKGKAKEYYQKGIEKAKGNLKRDISEKYTSCIKHDLGTIMRIKKKMIM